MSTTDNWTREFSVEENRYVVRDKTAEVRRDAEKATARLQAEEEQRQSRERSEVMPRVQQLEINNGKVEHTLNLMLQLIKRTDSELDALQAEKKSLEERILKLESGSASAERVHQAIEQGLTARNEATEAKNMASSSKRRCETNESKIAKSDARISELERRLSEDPTLR